ncbi:TKL protein kinase [Phytophthora cinnamomi]|uniref:TKL protein kinase n=1 Tax=Phytophthora cinnamomi TaxID=4785 RepID=UPI003559EE16|nr:TKL protein kinase [Phytophthora cinnamomi]
MREYSLESLKNDTGGDVGTVKDPFTRGSSGDGSDKSEASDSPAPETPTAPHATPPTSDAQLPQKHGIPNEGDSTINLKKGLGMENDPKDTADSYIYDYSGTSDQFATTAPSTDVIMGGSLSTTPTETPTPQPTSNASAFDTAQQIRTTDNSKSLSGGAIAGVVVAAACVMLMVAMFVTTKKRKSAGDPLDMSKDPAILGDSGVVPLASSRLAPLGVFGTLASRKNNREQPDMSSGDIFTIDHNDPFSGGGIKKPTDDSSRGSGFFVIGHDNPTMRGKTEVIDSMRGSSFFVIEHDDPTVRGKKEVVHGKKEAVHGKKVTKESKTVSDIFGVEHNDLFTRKHMRKGGIWDDPVLVAARIPLNKIRIQELIARGGFGQVFLGSYNGETVAVKTLLPETAQDMTEINALFAETKVMAKLEHPCIVRFVGIAWESLSTICCVTEYLVGGDLRALLNHFLTNHTRPRGYDHDKVKIALDVAHGLAYLHSMQPNILHRDLKSRNILLNSQLNAKLTDFGVSREHTEDQMTNAVGTSLWMAPEVMMGSHYDAKADVYSFGVMLSELDTHLMPYANAKNENGRKLTDTMIMRKVAAGELQVEFSRECPVEILTLAHACIAVDPNKRPTALDAMRKLRVALEAFEAEEVSL